MCRFATAAALFLTAGLVAFLTVLSARAPGVGVPPAVIVSAEVRAALARGDAVVALESTIVAHGMPYPQNLKTALEVERRVRDAGAVPATVAIIGGAVRVGLSEAQLERIARSGHEVSKASRRDLALAVASGLDGATTVASTSWAAHAAGISVFVTGGVGGVHRGAEQTMDISADLTELGRTPICVVSAGVKSLLDIGKTLEYLETQGVAVAAYGTDEFPAFFTRKSGFKAPMRVDTPEQAAAMIDASDRLRMSSGMLVAVPIPSEFEADGAVVEKAIQEALEESHKQGVSGRDITPFMLKRVAELTKGASLDSNIALVKHNADIGARIAVALSKIRKPAARKLGFVERMVQSMCQCDWPFEDLFVEPEEELKQPTRPHPVVVLGGTLVDVVARAETEVLPRTSNPGSVSLQVGGVGRNVAEVLARLGANPFVISAVSDDSFGNVALNHYAEVGMSTEGVIRITSSTAGTAVFTAIMDHKGQQSLAVSDTAILKAVTPSDMKKFEHQIAAAKMAVLDGNFEPETARAFVELAKKHSVPVWFEPTSVAKSIKPIIAEFFKQIDFVSPNQDELVAMSKQLGHPAIVDPSSPTMDEVRSMVETLLVGGVKTVLAKLGPTGAIVAQAGQERSQYKFFGPPKPREIVNVAGAGDSLVGASIWGISMHGMAPAEAIRTGMIAARLSLESRFPVSPLLSAELLLSEKPQAMKSEI